VGPTAAGSEPAGAVLVPVKAFGAAKSRLAPAVDPSTRARLARSMAERVLAAAAPLPVAVVCDDPEVATWAAGRGAQVLRAPGVGLNRAVASGRAALAARGFDRVAVVHSDLPAARNLAALLTFDGLTLVPDRHRVGTNVLCLPSTLPFSFSYGPGSFERHLTAARASGLPVRVLEPLELTWDVDVPDDVAAALAHLGPSCLPA
jgi:2-phospho-L-lactate guanylyltransferase